MSTNYQRKAGPHEQNKYDIKGAKPWFWRAKKLVGYRGFGDTGCPTQLIHNRPVESPSTGRSESIHYRAAIPSIPAMTNHIHDFSPRPGMIRYPEYDREISGGVRLQGLPVAGLLERMSDPAQQGFRKVPSNESNGERQSLAILARR